MIDEHFELVKLLGKGGSSKVFLARDSEGNKCAIKAIRKDKNFVKCAAAAMLEREHETLQKLEGHPNIIKSLGINLNGTVSTQSASEDIMYNVLEFAKYGALSNFVRYTGGIEADVARLFVLQM